MCSPACAFFDLRSFCSVLVPPAHISCFFQLCFLTTSAILCSLSLVVQVVVHSLYSIFWLTTLYLSWRNHVSFHWMNKLLCCWRTYDVHSMNIAAYTFPFGFYWWNVAKPHCRLGELNFWVHPGDCRLLSWLFLSNPDHIDSWLIEFLFLNMHVNNDSSWPCSD